MAKSHHDKIAVISGGGTASGKRLELPADLVGTVSFLTGDDAAFITGQTLNVDEAGSAAKAAHRAHIKSASPQSSDVPSARREFALVPQEGR
jgi:NAD(P)-dependent dehydrogenase (short-subunit alcohol dehydrogenase family)